MSTIVVHVLDQANLTTRWFLHLGMMFGRHQLIKLSPKKTVEGFVGGYFATVIFAVLVSTPFPCVISLAITGKLICVLTF